MDSDYKFMTYKEAATALSTTVESVRVQAMRYNWQKRKNNKRQVTVGVPVERLDNSVTVHKQVITPPVHELQSQITVLAVELQSAKEKIELLEKQTTMLEKQTDDLKIDRDAWREQAKAKRSWFWRKVG